MAPYVCQWDDTSSTAIQWAHLTGTVGQTLTFAMERLAESTASSALSDPIHHV
jgi:hypothetical protein